MADYKDETTTTKEEWNEWVQHLNTPTIHLSDNDSRWGTMVSEGAQFIFHKMSDGSIDFEVYAPEVLTDKSYFDGKLNAATVKKLIEFLKDKTAY